MANIELDGANKKIKVDSGDLTFDIPGDIILDADGANVTFKDGGTSVLDLSNSSTDAVLTVSTQDKDLIIKGDDGGSAVTAATFDMSDAGTLILNHDLELGTDGSIVKFGNDNEIALTHVADTGLLLTDSGGTPTLQLHDANESIASDGSKVIITSGGTAFSLPTSDGSNGQVIQTNGSGVLSFAAAGGFTVSDITGATALAEQPAADDEIVLSDAGSLKRLDIKHIQSTPLFSAYHNTTQVISNDSATQVAFNTESNATNGAAGIDSDGKFASNVFTPTVAGYYFVKFGTTFAVTDTEAINIYIRRNSSAAYRMETRSSAGGTDTNGFQSSGILYLDSDDTCDVTIYVTNDDVTLNGLSSNIVYTYFQGWRLTGV